MTVEMEIQRLWELKEFLESATGAFNMPSTLAEISTFFQKTVIIIFTLKKLLILAFCSCSFDTVLHKDHCT